MLIDIVARVVLAPVLAWQAVATRRRAHMLPVPSGAISGVVGTGPQLRLLILGDSSAAGVGVPTQSEALLGQIIIGLKDHYEVRYDLVAESGARTGDVLALLPGLPSAGYDVVVTALGVNDVTKLTTLHQFIARQDRLIDYLQEAHGAQLVVVSGLPPMHQFPLLPEPMRWVLGRQAKRFDANLRRLIATKPGACALKFDMELSTSNMSADGFHPGAPVYAAWAARVLETIKAHDAQLDLPQPTT